MINYKSTTNYESYNYLGEFVCREFLKGGALSIGKLIEERAPPWFTVDKLRFH